MNVPKPRKLKSGTWFIQLRLGGESIPVTALSEKECIKQAEYIKSEYRAGKRQPKQEAPEKLPTLKEAIDSYIASKNNVLSPSTIRGYKVIERTRFKGLMDRSLSDISENNWIQACNEEAAICSAKTLTNSWRFIATVVRHEIKIELPAVTLPQIAPNERPFLDADQIKKFIDATEGNKYRVEMLLALSGLRRSEICGLRWENVDLKNRRILVKGAAVYDEFGKVVQKKENKNRSSTRYVPIMMDELYEALEREKRTDGLVAKCTPNALQKISNRICEKSGLPHVSVHGLRHSFASLAYHLNVPEKVTMQIGGWSDDKTMRKIYTHIAQADVKKYENDFAKFFKNANENANE